MFFCIFPKKRATLGKIKDAIINKLCGGSNMKKLLSLLLVSLLLLSFAACGGKRTDNNDSTADNTSQTGTPSRARETTQS